jgi:hypothetical protein
MTIDDPLLRLELAEVAPREMVRQRVLAGGEEDRERLFTQLEEKGFLLELAETSNSFRRLTEILETELLPAIWRWQDPQRLLRYSSMAMALRGLSSELCTPAILEALAQGGRFTLATDLATQQASSLARAQSHAVLAQQVDGQPSQRQALDRVQENLDAAPSPDTPQAAERWSETLAVVARHCGPALAERWPSWVARLGPFPAHAQASWWHLIQSFMQQQQWESPLFWRALEHCQTETIQEGWPAALGKAPRLTLAQFDHLAQELSLRLSGEVLDRCRLALLAHQARGGEGQDVLMERLQRWWMGRALRFSPQCADLGWPLWRRFPPCEVDRLAAAQTDPASRAILSCAAVGPGTERQREDRALEALAVASAQGAAGIQIALRLLEAWPSDDEKTAANLVAQLGDYLRRTAFDATPQELRGYLEWMARLWPARLATEVRRICWSPAGTAEFLSLLATSREVVLLQCLFDHAEEFAAAVATTRRRGFHLRREVLVAVATRLVHAVEEPQKWADLLEQAQHRLVPGEEEDALRRQLALELATRAPDEAQRIAGEITTLSLRRRVEIQLAASPPLHSLYQAVATTEGFEGTLSALRALLVEPEDAVDLDARYLARVGDERSRRGARCDLAWHALARLAASGFRSAKDPDRAVEPVRQAFAEATSDEQRVAWLPEVVLLGAQVSRQRALVEIQEAALLLPRLETASWASRLDALEAILARLVPMARRWLAETSSGERWWLRFRLRRLLRWLVRLPAGGGDQPQWRLLRQHRHHLFPILTATAEALGLSVATVVAKEWTEPVPEQLPILKLCCHTEEAYLHHLESLTPASLAEPDLAAAAAFTLAARAPDRLRAFLATLPPESDRDRIILRLVRGFWVAPPVTAALIELVNDRVSRRQARVWRDLGGFDPRQAVAPSREGVRALAATVALGDLDPLAAGNLSLHRSLWNCDAAAADLLAEAVSGALAQGGRDAASGLVYLWLHALLAPRLGQGQSENVATLNALEEALQGARSLASTPPGQNRGS